MTGNVQAVSQVGSTVADKYRLLRVLGLGGMGVVYEAQHAVTHRRVALKMMHSWVAETSPQAGMRFLREAQAAASIGHPAIVDVLDAGQLDDGTLYLVFEMLDGLDLEAALAADALTAGELISIAIDVLGGLEAAHAQGFVHRDIKPANVFLAKNHAGAREVKLLDFGIAKRVGASATFNGITAHGSIVGTLEYMSPEQASAHVVDGRTDLWALGALLFRALAGGPPFSGRNQLELVTAILLGPVPSLASRRPDLPTRLTDIVDRALKRERDERWATAGAMREALAALDRSEIPRALPASPASGDQTPVDLQARGELEAREAITPQDRELEDFAANEPTRRAIIPTPPRGVRTGSLSVSDVPVMLREEPTEIAKQRDIVTLVVRESEIEATQTPEIAAQPVLAPIPVEPIGPAETASAPNTQILLDASLQDEEMLLRARRSRSGRWTFAALLLATACAVGAWAWSNGRAAKRIAVEPALRVAPASRVEPAPRIDPAPLVESPRPVEPMPAAEEMPAAEPVPAAERVPIDELSPPAPLKAEEKKEKKRAKTKRILKKASEKPAAPQASDEFFYREDHL